LPKNEKKTKQSFKKVETLFEKYAITREIPGKGKRLKFWGFHDPKKVDEADARINERNYDIFSFFYDFEAEEFVFGNERFDDFS